MAVAAVTQVIVFTIHAANGQIPEAARGAAIVNYLIVPAIIFLAVIAVMLITVKLLNHGANVARASYMLLTIVSLMLFVMSHIYSLVDVICAILSLPIIGSMLYIDTKPLTFVFTLNLTVYLMYTTIILHTGIGNRKRQNFVEIIATISILIATYIAGRIILYSVSHLVHDIQTKDEEIRRDCFTGLFNHSSFYDKLDLLIIDNHRKDTVFSLIIWDIDNFKSINDTFGHDMGDKVLMLFTTALNECINDTDTAFRYGGEEFAVLACRKAKDAHALSICVRERFTLYTSALPLGKAITASAGICEYSREFGGSREFFSAADRALYVAKRSHDKNASHLWNDKIVENPNNPAKTIFEE